MWMLRVRQANCYADLSDDCPDASWLLRQPLRGHLAALREMFPGDCSDTARLFARSNARMIHRLWRGCFAGRYALCCADIARRVALNLCKGMGSNQNDRLSHSRKPPKILFN
jgi:hypothetical protein